MRDLSKVKLGIALPNVQDTYPSQFVDTFCQITKPKHLYLKPTGGGPIDAVRNDLVRKAFLCDCTHLWMTDTDQVYPQDVLMRLLEHDLDIVAAKVHIRYPPYEPLLLRGNLDHFDVVSDPEWSSNGGQLVEVDATGFGSVLLNMKVFEDIDQPWFEFDLHNHKTPVGEDIGFYMKARAAGYKVFVDCSIKIGHLVRLVVNEDSYFAYKDVADGKSGIKIEQGGD
jgi:hypothetical protein